MSQQEFVPEFQQQQEQEKQTQGSTIFGRKPSFRPRKARGVPKNDHPSTFDESIPPHSYQARESSSSSQGQRDDKERSRKPARMTSWWRSYTYYTGREQTPWRRAKKSIWSLIGMVLLVIIAIKALPIIIGVATALLGILALLILLPIIVVLALLVAVAVMTALAYIGITRYRRKIWR